MARVVNPTQTSLITMLHVQLWAVQLRLMNYLLYLAGPICKHAIISLNLSSSISVSMD